ncbi:MAG TPA: alpha/beta fold hydrolase [Anaerolineae bacterium]
MRVQLHDFAMEYEDKANGTPLLFIHGYPLNRTLWEPQFALSDAARVIAPDLPGHGMSDPVATAQTMDTYAEDLHQLLDVIGARQPAVVCGLSMGGYVAFAFYRKYASRVRGLIFAATKAGADSAEGKAGRDKSAATAKEKGASAIAEAMLPKMFAPKTYQMNPALVARAKAMMESTPVAGIVGDLMGMRDRPDSTPTLAQINVPTLVLHGADDQLIPSKEAEATHAGIKNSKLVLVPEAGHLLNLEQPDAFNRAVREFLKSL